MGHKLREVRKKARLTLEQVAQRAGTTNQMVGMLERGERKLTVEWMNRLAPALGCLPSDLLEDAPPRLIPVVGYVGAGAEIFSIDDHLPGAGLEEIEPPHAGMHPDTVAVKVRGDSMVPVYREGDVVLYDRQVSGHDLKQLVGKDCVVRLKDGRTFLKELHIADGLYWLHSHNATPMMGVQIDWASKVYCVLKG